MKEAVAVRRFVEADAGAVRNIILRGLREIDAKDYPPEYIEKTCAAFTVDRILSQAGSAHMYVAVSGAEVVGTGSIAPYRGRPSESILLTIFVLPECIGQGVGTSIVGALEKDEYFLRASRVEIPSSVTAAGFYLKMGYAPKNGLTPDGEGLVRMEKFR
ncbi:MAG: GNAT family N-acetyltransferase [Lentisphaeria bacterium]|nr:GNAT family N-acetyltransferase [Lentisphaeria bacterium]